MTIDDVLKELQKDCGVENCTCCTKDRVKAKLALLEIIKGVKPLTYCGHDEKEEFINKICPHCRSKQEGVESTMKAIEELFK